MSCQAAASSSVKLLSWVISSTATVCSRCGRARLYLLVLAVATSHDGVCCAAGKVLTTTSGMERPPRYNAKRESVENQLEDAAVKLANKPVRRVTSRADVV